MPKKYAPIKRTRLCPHGCGMYTINYTTGKLRKHSIDRCGQGCVISCDGSIQLASK